MRVLVDDPGGTTQARVDERGTVIDDGVVVTWQVELGRHVAVDTTVLGQDGSDPDGTDEG